MLSNSQSFLKFAIEQQVLKFGNFTLKSGRQSPYFFNAGLFNSGKALSNLASFYAQAIQNSELEYDVLFGPAYKGIPLVAATSMALFQQFQLDMPFCFNRKEIKDHGEGGVLVGAPLKGKVLLIDDVITAGTAIKESLALIRKQGAEPVGVVVALDRQEKGLSNLSAIQELEQQEHIRIISITSLSEMLDYLKQQQAIETLQAVQHYREQYGI
ncbi:MAG: orotate phosphoribosyltransferase [Pseudomonadota bacterium]|jgi:orotate phosphoribosyltransferase